MLKINFARFKKHIINATLVFMSATLFLTGCSATPSVTTNPNTNPAVSNTTAKPTAPKPTKRVAITFDDGPHKTYTVNIVNELEKYNFNATFFVVGNRVDGTSYRGGSATQYAISKGNEIAIHGYTHKYYYNSCSEEKYDEEINKTIQAIKGISPEYDVKLMRPIGGAISKTRIEESPYSIIIWNVDPEDWKHKYSSGDSEKAKKEKLDTIVSNVMSNIDDGDIILMHDIYESTYDAVKILLPLLVAEGYEVVTVSELLGNPLPGTKYSHG
jgi:peptidoglycan/xylan/chitin deacetylase (PgdA/CDA1 family)